MTSVRLKVLVGTPHDDFDPMDEHDVARIRSERSQQIQSQVQGMGQSIAQRVVVFHPEARLKVWAQDSSKPLVTGQPLISLNRRFARTLSAARYPEVGQVNVDFEGGNLVVGDGHIFSLSTLTRNNNLTSEPFERFFSKPIFMLDSGKIELPLFDANFHADHLIASIWSPTQSKEVTAISSPLMARRALLKGHPPRARCGADSRRYESLRAIFYVVGRPQSSA